MDMDAREAESLSYETPLPTALEAFMRRLEIHITAKQKRDAIHLIEITDLAAVCDAPRPVLEPADEADQADFFDAFRKFHHAKDDRIAKLLRCKIERVVEMRKKFRETRHQERLAYARKQSKQFRAEMKKGQR